MMINKLASQKYYRDFYEFLRSHNLYDRFVGTPGSLNVTFLRNLDFEFGFVIFREKFDDYHVLYSSRFYKHHSFCRRRFIEHFLKSDYEDLLSLKWSINYYHNKAICFSEDYEFINFFYNE